MTQIYILFMHRRTDTEEHQWYDVPLLEIIIIMGQ